MLSQNRHLLIVKAERRSAINPYSTGVTARSALKVPSKYPKNQLLDALKQLAADSPPSDYDGTVDRKPVQKIRNIQRLLRNCDGAYYLVAQAGRMPAFDWSFPPKGAAQNNLWSPPCAALTSTGRLDEGRQSRWPCRLDLSISRSTSTKVGPVFS